jgi:hypothetical protein
MTPKQLRNHIYKTYWWLRVGLCVLALAFPFLLLGVGWLNGISLQDSMSEYYFAFDPHESPLRVFPVRVVFAGVLFALGFSLMLYRGLSKLENVLLNIAFFCPRCRTLSNADAVLVHLLWQQYIFLCARSGRVCCLWLPRYCCFVLYKDNFGQIACQ